MMKRPGALVLTVSLTAAFPDCSYHSGLNKEPSQTERQASVRADRFVVIPATLTPRITIPIANGGLTLAATLNTPVQRGERIGVVQQPSLQEDAECQRDHGVLQAEENLRQIDEELNAKDAEIARMRTQESQAADFAREAQEEFAQRERLFRAGLMSQAQYDAAVLSRASADAALDSLRSKIAANRIELEELRAKAGSTRTTLNAALERRDATSQRNIRSETVYAAASGILLASEEQDRVLVGIASDPSQVSAYAEIAPSDLALIHSGQQASIVLDGRPSVSLRARVMEISAIPAESTKVSAYRIALTVENPSGTWLIGAAVHLWIEQSLR